MASARTWGGKVEAGVGAFIVLNADGWFATAGHVLEMAVKRRIDRPKVDALRAELSRVASDSTMKSGVKHRETKRLERTADRDWVTAASYNWTDPSIAFRDVTIVPEADLAVGRLEPLPAHMATSFPRLKQFARDELPSGRSICRLGFPFHRLTPTYDPATDTFGFGGQQIDLTFFPLDGIITRGIDSGTTRDGRHPLIWIEASTPGIRGQSGGPVFGTDGVVWGIQSRTQHIPLGFSPEVEGPGGRKVVENQVINLGVAISTITLISVLRGLNISYTAA